MACVEVAGSDYPASLTLRLPVTLTTADLTSVKYSGERPEVEITADGWFVIAKYNAKLAKNCSDPVLAERFRERARKALQRLSMFELTRPAKTELSGHRLGSGAKD
jgi:hypothetical protein